ncbi:cytosine deaminase [Oscillatoria sp. FACHB-1406]|uniref:cytosine deaminase n=1 Tax=Oscillatoria sp. FACHB-1406 TaxID=2692846 RepID=UPI0016895307|nr:cytosine deaminase [Oscillatoria sp. FACHB-1406]MBD2577535.1 cytosine deaminase [Oscillatoria sp. FACHB-1406]
MFPSDRYWLKNARIPVCLIENGNFSPQTREGLCEVDLEIVGDKIAQLLPAGTSSNELPQHDLKKGIVLPCFADIHTHLDKAHIWERAAPPDYPGTFESAIAACQEDVRHWDAEDLYRRMEFALKCSYAHGTKAIRTHLDSFGAQADISWEVWKTLQREWRAPQSGSLRDRITLQAVVLVSLDYFLTKDGVKLADKVAEWGGVLGGVAYLNPELDRQLESTFILARERNLSLDFHVDENANPNSICLKKVAETALKFEFKAPILCGHCCSLAVQPPDLVRETLNLVKQANIGIVSLPMCNLYLQDRQSERTPHWRGVTLVHELKNHQIPVSFASDNCRDPFFGFGDHDILEVFQQSVRIAHLDTPYRDWIASVTRTPADLMGLGEVGRIGVGFPADLILFKARTFSELLARSQRDRVVIRNGQAIDTTLPDYAELDESDC